MRIADWSDVNEYQIGLNHIDSNILIPDIDGDAKKELKSAARFPGKRASHEVECNPPTCRVKPDRTAL